MYASKIPSVNQLSPTFHPLYSTRQIISASLCHYLRLCNPNNKECKFGFSRLIELAVYRYSEVKARNNLKAMACIIDADLACYPCAQYCQRIKDMQNLCIHRQRLACHVSIYTHSSRIGTMTTIRKKTMHYCNAFAREGFAGTKAWASNTISIRA